MDLHVGGAKRLDDDDYLFGRGAAWFAFVMTCGLMLFDYIDRQVIVSLFPHLKEEWGLSDKQLGALASIVSVTVALAGIPVALAADRFSRVKSIVVMALGWSLASISCMFTGGYRSPWPSLGPPAPCRYWTGHLPARAADARGAGRAAEGGNRKVVAGHQGRAHQGRVTRAQSLAQ
jgi:MFS family permease